MLNFDERIDALVKHCPVTKDEIIQCLFANEREITEDYLLNWNICEEINNKTMYVLFASGAGDKLLPRIKEIASKNGCTRILFVTQRPKAFERKYGFKPIGTLMEMEVG